MEAAGLIQTSPLFVTSSSSINSRNTINSASLRHSLFVRSQISLGCVGRGDLGKIDKRRHQLRQTRGKKMAAPLFAGSTSSIQPKLGTLELLYDPLTNAMSQLTILSRPQFSIYRTSPLSGPSILSASDTLAYLTRIGLPPSSIDQQPSIELLNELFYHHQLNIGFDTSYLSVPEADWARCQAGSATSAEEIQLGSGVAVDLGEESFHRIVDKRRGGICCTCDFDGIRVEGIWVQMLGCGRKV